MTFEIPIRFPGSRDLTTARFFDTLASLLDAGLTPAMAFDQEGVARLAGSRHADAAAALHAGAGLAHAVRILQFDERTAARVEAAESAGRVSRGLRRLARERARRAENVRRAAAQLLYPIFLIHFAAAARGVVASTRGGGPGSFWAEFLWVAVPVDASIYLIWRFLCNAAGGGRAAGVASAVPFLSEVLRDLAAAPFLLTLADLYDSGVPLDRALERASLGAPPRMRAALAGASAAVRAGGPLVPALAAAVPLDATSLAILQPAEVSGTLSEGLVRAGELVDERTSHALAAGSRGPGALLYAFAIVLIAWTIINFYSGIYQLPAWFEK